MSTHNEKNDSIDAAMTAANGLGIAGISVNAVDGAHITVGGRNLINFSSCSYLGLEHHPQLKCGAHAALEKYGTQFSSSKAYIYCSLYDQLDAELTKIFGVNPIIGASTTLAHAAAIPIIVNDNDVVLFDMQVHASVQMNLPELTTRGVKVTPVKHNDLNHLESRIKRELKTLKPGSKIVYMCDGIYSMHGDVIDVTSLHEIINLYPQLVAYVDDAHGMSWTGMMGAGHVLGYHTPHERIIVALGLSKGFACAGGVIIVHDEALRTRIKNCGRTLIFSGPIQPPMLGACVESAKLHSSRSILPLQTKVHDLIHAFNTTVQRLDLYARVRYNDHSPIRFISVGDEEQTFNAVVALKDKGYFVNAGAYPAVPRGKAGLRIVLNANHRFDEIYALVTAIKEVI